MKKLNEEIYSKDKKHKDKIRKKSDRIGRKEYQCRREKVHRLCEALLQGQVGKAEGKIILNWPVEASSLKERKNIIFSIFFSVSLSLAPISFSLSSTLSILSSLSLSLSLIT